jgi:ketosteroid isomerase-like protein
MASEEGSTAKNADIVRSMYDAYNGGDHASALAVMDPDVVWDFTEAPDGLVYRGLDEVEKFFAMLGEVWESLRIEVIAQTERGNCVMSDVRVVGRGRGSGVAVQHHETHIWRLRDGRLVEGKTHLDRAMAVAPC